MDDPHNSSFSSFRSYLDFENKVRRSRRFVWDNEIKTFLSAVRATLKDRDRQIAKGSVFYRAQSGIDYVPLTNEEDEEYGLEPTGYGSARMKPLADKAREGRVNPLGVPVLYLANCPQTAISEVRPWIGTEVSLAQFKTMRDLKIVDFSIGFGQNAFIHLMNTHVTGEGLPSTEDIEKSIWIQIDNAFSRPITPSDDVGEYVPTQILAEFFKDAGYDGIVYRSQFAANGYNIALFNLNDAEPIACVPYKINEVEVKFEVIGNAWRKTEPKTEA